MLLPGGDQTEPKGRLGLNVLAFGVPDCAAWYLLVLRVLFLIVADGTVYHGYCKSCFYPAVDEE